MIGPRVFYPAACLAGHDVKRAAPANVSSVSHPHQYLAGVACLTNVEAIGASRTNIGGRTVTGQSGSPPGDGRATTLLRFYSRLFESIRG
jgi:hypothetical protein